jgi:phosphoribosylformylglycinamidine synthase
MAGKKIGIVIFPGTNCDHDLVHVVRAHLKLEAVPLWHSEADLKGVAAVLIPGGFSYGDYLRTGALAKLSPLLGEVKKFAEAGGPVVGVCNGFQILCEAQFLPGALLINQRTQFLSRPVSLKIEQNSCVFTKGLDIGTIFSAPIAHGEGRYYVPNDQLKSLQDHNQIVFRYTDQDGAWSEKDFNSNPNGSLLSIAGICNKQGNVVGLMPHPERVVDEVVGGEQGLALFRALASSL